MGSRPSIIKPKVFESPMMKVGYLLNVSISKNKVLLSIYVDPRIKVGLPLSLEVTEALILIFILFINLNLFLPLLVIMVLINFSNELRQRQKNKKLVKAERERVIWAKEFYIGRSSSESFDILDNVCKDILKICQIKLYSKKKYTQFNKPFFVNEFNNRTRQDFQKECLTNEIIEFTDLLVTLSYNGKWILESLIPLEFYNIDYLIGETRIYKKYHEVKKLLRLFYKKFPTTMINTKQTYQFSEGYLMTPQWIHPL